MAQRVVINADDLGLHPAVRRAIERLADVGTLTSASILANGPDLEATRRQLGTSLPGVSFGAHLNILRGRPLSPGSEVRSLLGPDGLFLGDYRALHRRHTRGELVLGEVELEWSRQVEHLRSLGFELWHADGEKHTHAWPGLFESACRVARRYGIPFVRRPAERWRPRASLLGQARVLLLRRWLASTHPRESGGVRFLDEVWGIADQGRALRPGRFIRSTGLRGAITSDRAVEIVCHPGLEEAGDGELAPDFGRMRVRALWGPEFASLSDRSWRPTLEAAGWEFTDFQRLAAEARPARSQP